MQICRGQQPITRVAASSQSIHGNQVGRIVSLVCVWQQLSSLTCVAPGGTGWARSTAIEGLFSVDSRRESRRCRVLVVIIPLWMGSDSSVVPRWPLSQSVSASCLRQRAVQDKTIMFGTPQPSLMACSIPDIWLRAPAFTWLAPPPGHWASLEQEMLSLPGPTSMVPLLRLWIWKRRRQSTPMHRPPRPQIPTISTRAFSPTFWLMGLIVRLVGIAWLTIPRGWVLPATMSSSQILAQLLQTRTSRNKKESHPRILQFARIMYFKSNQLDSEINCGKPVQPAGK